MSEKEVKAAETAAAAQAPAEAPVAAAKPASKASAEFVPVFTEDGEAIPRNSVLRVRTVSGSLMDPSGNRITENNPVELLGPDIIVGDWYTVQFEAGLLVVDSVKKLK